MQPLEYLSNNYNIIFIWTVLKKKKTRKKLNYEQYKQKWTQTNIITHCLFYTKNLWKLNGRTKSIKFLYIVSKRKMITSAASNKCFSLAKCCTLN